MVGPVGVRCGNIGDDEWFYIQKKYFCVLRKYFGIPDISKDSVPFVFAIMKRSFHALEQCSSTRKDSQQPDFSSLDLGCAQWQPSEWTSTTSDVGRSSPEAGRSLRFHIMEQYLEDQLWQISGENTIVENRPTSKKCFGKSKVTSASSHEFAQLAEDARELWEELKPRESVEGHRLGSCCTSICSTVASAASTLSSSTFSSLCPVSSASHCGSTPSFSMDCRGISTMTLTTQTTCSATPSSEQEATPKVSVHDPALALAAADAAVAAATHLLRQALERRDAAVASKSVASVVIRRPAHAELEEFTLGAGWPLRH